MRLRKRWWRVTGGASFETTRNERRDVRARTETGAVKEARKQVGGYMMQRIESICPHAPACRSHR